MCEHRRAVALKVLVEPQPGAGLGEKRRQRCRADHERLAPKVLAVELKEVEGRYPSCLISWIQRSPAGGLGVAIGRQGAMRRETGDDMATAYRARPPSSHAAP